MSILYLSWSIPPSPKASSILSKNIADNFDGETIILVGEKVLGSNLNTENLKYKTYYVNPFLFNKSKGYQYIRWFYFFSIYQKIKKIIVKEKCRAIICSFPNEFYLALAYRLSEKLQLPFYPWFHNLYIENMKGYRLSMAKWLQPRVFNLASEILTMSDGMNNYMRIEYSDYIEKFTPFKHGFSIPSKVENFSEEKIPIKVLFSYTGTFHQSCKDASIRLCSVIVQNPNYELHVFGGSNKKVFIENGIEGDLVFFHGFLEEEVFKKKLSNIHIHLLPHGFEEDSLSQIEIDTIFPTRTIPLLSSGRPILANSPKSSFLTEFLTERKCAYVVETKDEKDIIKAINEIIQNNLFRIETVNNAIEASKEFNITDRIKELKEILEK